MNEALADDAAPGIGATAGGGGNLTDRQLLMWLEEQLAPGVPSNNMVALFWITPAGPLDEARFARAFASVVARSDALRTVFDRMAGGGVRQRTRAELADPATTAGLVEVVDLSAAGDPRAAWRAWFDDRRRQPFRLDQRAFDTALVRLGDREVVWYLALHHLITDASSFALVYRHTMAAYQGAAAAPLPAFSDAIEHAGARRRTPEHQAAAAFWRERLGERIERVRFYGRTEASAPASSRRRTVAALPGHLEGLRLASRGRAGALAGEQGVAAAFAAVTMAWVHRVSGNRRIGVGMPVQNRPSRRFAETIGLFLEIPWVRAEVEEGETFASLMDKVRRDLFTVLPHSRHTTSNPARQPAYEVMVNYQTAKFPPVLGATRTELHTGTTDGGAPGAREAVVLTVHDFEGSGEPALTFDFHGGVFDEALADRAVGHFQRLLEACIADPQRRIAEVDLLSEDERRQVLVEFNRTEEPLPEDETVLDLFEARARQDPGRVAVRCGDRSLSYGELAAAVDRMAARLRRAGVRADQRVAVRVPRTPEMVVALLAVWKAGAAYVPIDPTHPRARVEGILEDAQPAVLVTWGAARGELVVPGETRVVCVDEDGDGDGSGNGNGNGNGNGDGNERVAYVLFTSGSTGRPKGVEMEHRGLVNILRVTAREPGLAAGERMAAVSTVAFDIAAVELFLPLVVGATVELIDRETASDGQRLSAYFEREPVALIFATPATWRMLVDSGWRGRPGLRVMTGGEVLPPDLAGRLLERCAGLWNIYGPTETTVYSTIQRVESVDGAPIAIGRPVANTQVYVLGAGGHPLPVGVPGEIYIGGAGVGRGYVARPELTRERFLPDPHATRPGARRYRTGDLGSFSEDGTLWYHGRADRQIKLRGFRIEPGEIEAALRAHPAVRDCAVVLRTVAGDPRLVAYLVRADAAADPPAAPLLRAFLAERVPDYMVPASYVTLEKLPLSPNGKIDQEALPAPETAGVDAGRPFDPPANDTEVRLAALWSELLGLAQVGRRDDFFALGGHSLLAVRLVQRIRQSFQVELGLATLFQERTIEGLAQALIHQHAGGPALVPLQARGDKPPLFFICGVQIYHQLAQRLGDDQPSYGIFLPAEERMFQGAPSTVEELARDYLEMIRATQPRGPYRLAGLSFGGLLAFEIAQRLRAAGEEVALLTLLDSLLPRARKRALLPWTLDHLRQLGRLDLSSFERLGRSMLSRFGVGASALPDAPPSEEEQLDQLRVALYARAGALYDPHMRPYPGRVLLVRALDREVPVGWRVDGLAGWDQVVTGPLEVVDVPGEHLGILRPPYVDLVARHLREALDAVESVAGGGHQSKNQPDRYAGPRGPEVGSRTPAAPPIAPHRLL